MNITVARALALLMLFAAACLGEPQQKPPVLNQKHIGESACGPCSVINALAWGDQALRRRLAELPGDTLQAKVQGIIDTFGPKPSVAYEGKSRYRAADGMTWLDVPPFFNDALQGSGKSVTGAYMDRGAGESLDAHLRRVHGRLKRSIDAGVPVVTSLRSFAPKFNEQDEKYLWEGLHGHWVTIVAVSDEPADNQKGFTFKYADPGTGRVEHGYLWYDEARNFTAARGDAQKWEWLPNRPFLLVTAPSLRLNTQRQPWHLRTIVTLNYVVTGE
jgi:hypothetical protein